MTIQFSEAVRNASLNTLETTIGASGFVLVYDGAPPASPALAATGTLLSSITLSTDWMGASTAGAVTMNALPVAGIGLSTGTAGYFRLTASDGVTCGIQGTVGLTTAEDMTLNTVTIVVGGGFNITGFTLTDGNP